ncbi:MAG TPA: NAD(P)(+) transhydrogenase (Re/Si-specific) subunit beta, partial [Acidimicrobiales bacterium]
MTTGAVSVGPLDHPVTALSMPLSTWRDLVYLIAIIGFIVAMKGLSSPKRARQGNLVGAASAVLAVAITFTNPVVHHAGTNLALALVA